MYKRLFSLALIFAVLLTFGGAAWSCTAAETEEQHTPFQWYWNEEGHWFLCGCMAMLDRGPHTFVWAFDQFPTTENPGVKHEVCTACGCTQSEDTTVPLLTANLPGDANRDSRVTTTDARLALQFAAERIRGDQLDLSAADVNGGGYVTTLDARLILQYAAGRITHFD